MKTINDNLFEGILLEDPVVEDVVPTEPEAQFDPMVAFFAVMLPPLLTAAAAPVIKEGSIFVWGFSAIVGAYYTVRRLTVYQAILATGVYWVLMLFGLICVAALVGNVIVLHGE